MTIWRRIASGVLIAIAGLAVLLTVIPVVPSNAWWIRIWDFPRVQILAVSAICLALLSMLLNLRLALVRAGLALLIVAGCWQAYRIWPYSPFAPIEAVAVASCPAESSIRLLTANVLVSNRSSAPLLALVERTQPDVLLLLETNQWWDEELTPLKQDYPEHIALPRDDGYGMHFFSHFQIVDSEVRNLLEDYVPSIRASLRLPSGDEIAVYGVHPVPPPLQDTAKRDAELLLIGREMRDDPSSAIVAGDLNDVGWSTTTRLFREISGALDARIGRGPFSTFNADWPLLRWPLDHVFFDPDFLFADMQVMDHIGSDHFPLLVDLCHAPASPAAAAQRERGPASAEERRASQAIERGREVAREP